MLRESSLSTAPLFWYLSLSLRMLARILIWLLLNTVVPPTANCVQLHRLLALLEVCSSACWSRESYVEQKDMVFAILVLSKESPPDRPSLDNASKRGCIALVERRHLPKTRLQRLCHRLSGCFRSGIDQSECPYHMKWLNWWSCHWLIINAM